MLILEIYLDILTGEKITEVASSYTSGMLYSTAKKQALDYMTDASRACANRQGIDEALCMTNVKIETQKRLLDELARVADFCQRANDPNKCRDDMAQKIRKEESELVRLNKTLSMYRARAGK